MADKSVSHIFETVVSLYRSVYVQSDNDNDSDNDLLSVGSVELNCNLLW